MDAYHRRRRHDDDHRCRHYHHHIDGDLDIEDKDLAHPVSDTCTHSIRHSTCTCSDLLFLVRSRGSAPPERRSDGARPLSSTWLLGFCSPLRNETNRQHSLQGWNHLSLESSIEDLFPRCFVSIFITMSIQKQAFRVRARSKGKAINNSEIIDCHGTVTTFRDTAEILL